MVYSRVLARVYCILCNLATSIARYFQIISCDTLFFHMFFVSFSTHLFFSRDGLKSDIRKDQTRLAVKCLAHRAGVSGFSDLEKLRCQNYRRACLPVEWNWKRPLLHKIQKKKLRRIWRFRRFRRSRITQENIKAKVDLVAMWTVALKYSRIIWVCKWATSNCYIFLFLIRVFFLINNPFSRWRRRRIVAMRRTSRNDYAF